jgi:acetyl esterase/lipase
MSGLDSSFSMRLLQTTGLFLALLTASAAGVRAADANDTDTEIGANGATRLGDPVIPNVPAGPGGPATAVATASSICHAFHQKPRETCVLDDRKIGHCRVRRAMRVTRRLSLRILAAALALMTAATLNAPSLASERNPGKLITAQAMPGAPEGARAYRILYWSTGLDGKPVEVSGVVIAPGGSPLPGGRPVAAWAHPTTGVVSRCAPSLARVFFASIQGLRAMLDQGYVVAATDYPGLGTPEVHPYLVGTSEAHAVLDSVRAAKQIPEAAAGARFAVWGHSQGGQAALFTGIEAARYAPELKLVGVAAAAPATDLAQLMTDDLGTGGGNNITAMTLWSWARVYGAPMDKVVMPEAEPVVDRLTKLCIERWFDVLTRRGPTRGLEKSFLRVNNFADLEPWRRLLEENSPGVLPADIPVFLAQGSADGLVRPAVTEAYRARLCRNGNRVEFVLVPGVGHAFIARDVAGAAVAWMAGRFAGEPAPTNCGT